MEIRHKVAQDSRESSRDLTAVTHVTHFLRETSSRSPKICRKKDRITIPPNKKYKEWINPIVF